MKKILNALNQRLEYLVAGHIVASQIIEDDYVHSLEDIYSDLVLYYKFDISYLNRELKMIKATDGSNDRILGIVKDLRALVDHVYQESPKNKELSEDDCLSLIEDGSMDEFLKNELLNRSKGRIRSILKEG